MDPNTRYIDDLLEGFLADDEPAAPAHEARAAALHAARLTELGDVARAALARASAAAVPRTAWALPPVTAGDYERRAEALAAAALSATVALRAAAAAGAEPVELDALLVRPRDLIGDGGALAAGCGAAIAAFANVANAVDGGFYPFLDINSTITPPRPMERAKCETCAAATRPAPPAARAGRAARNVRPSGVAIGCPVAAERLVRRFAPSIADLDLRALGLVIAGGFFSQTNPYRGGCDVDLWLVGHRSPESAAAAIAAVARAVVETHPSAHVVRSRFAVTFTPHRHQGFCPVQVILRPYRSVAEAISAFDIGAAATAWDGHHVVMTPLGALAAWRSTVVVDFDRVSSIFARRLAKYFGRGYAMHVPGLTIPPHSIGDRPFLAEVAFEPVLVLPSIAIFGVETESRHTALLTGANTARRALISVAVRAAVASRRAEYPDDAHLADRAAVARGVAIASERNQIRSDFRVRRGAAEAAALGTVDVPGAIDTPDVGGNYGSDDIGVYCSKARVLYRNVEAVRNAERRAAARAAPGAVAEPGEQPPVSALAIALLATALTSVGGVLAIEPEFDPEFIEEVATRALAAGRLMSVRATLGFGRATLQAFADWTPADIRAVCIGRAAICTEACRIGAAWPRPADFTEGAVGAAFGGAPVPPAVWLGAYAAPAVQPAPPGAAPAPDAVAIEIDVDAPRGKLPIMLAIELERQARDDRRADHRGDAEAGGDHRGDAEAGDDAEDDSQDEL